MFFYSLPNERTVNEHWLQLKRAIVTATQKNIPSKLVTSRNKCPPWLSSSVRRAIRKRDSLAKAAKKSGSQVARVKYRKARNAATREISKGYFSHLNDIIGNVKSDPRNFFRFNKSKKSDLVGIPSLKSNGNIITDDHAKAECKQLLRLSLYTWTPRHHS